MIKTATRARAGVPFAALVVLVTALVALAGCAGGGSGGSAGSGGAGGPGRPGGTTPANAPGTVGGNRGDLRVRGAYIPAETSPDVAAAYFSVTNTSGSADRLLSVSTPEATATLHENVTNGALGSMREVADLVIPAHATVALSPGGRHVMLMNPSHLLRENERVPLTVTFARAGALTLDVPVVARTGPTGAGAS
jgi:copper(I)-binding protein